MAEESTSTVLLAGAANLAIAVAKAVGGLLSGSAAMLAEAAHSVADTLNELLLLTAIHRSHKPPDASHPFGYGQERYFWSLLAAVGILVLGAGFSVLEGIRSVLQPEELGSLLVVYLILLVSFAFEATSWLKAIVQLRREARDRRRGFFQHLGQTSDPTAKTVAFEDTAALIGLVLAAAGVTLHHLTKQGFWDGAASVAIGLLLVLVAYALGRQNMSLLIGRALPLPAQLEIRDEIARSDGIDRVIELLSMRLGPEEVLIAVRVDLAAGASSDALERYADEVDASVRERFPEVRHVFLDPTPPSHQPYQDPITRYGGEPESG